MNKRIIIGIMLVFTLLLLIPPINAIEQQTIEVMNCKPACIPIITYPSYIYAYGNISEITAPIPPSSTVIIPYYIEYRIDVPKILQYLPGMLSRLWLFNSFIQYPHELRLTNSEMPDYIDIAFLTPSVYIMNFLLSGDASTGSTDIIITIYENAPCDVYSFNVHTYSKEIGRIESCNHTRTFQFEVGYD